MAEDPHLSFTLIHRKAQDFGLTAQQINSLPAVRRLGPQRKPWLMIVSVSSLGLLLLGMVLFAIQWPLSRERVIQTYMELYGSDFEREGCLVNLADKLSEFVRPPVDCNICKDVRQVDAVSGISVEEFEQRYAYTGRPVVIKDGMRNWTAPETFSFDFFKSMYTDDSPALANQESMCQFFPYKTAFMNLGEALNMSRERVNLQDGEQPWYFGWSNCDSTVANVLRKHYDRPYFLPKVSESSKTDWIFMGSPGYGAHMHIDNVEKPSWQAQVTGHKLWTIEAPPECYHVCEQKLEVVIKPGEIFVFDSNLWFHSTEVQGDEISICIGSEYD